MGFVYRPSAFMLRDSKNPVESEEERITDLLALKQAMGILPAKDRSLIVFRYFQGKTQTETAKLLGMTQVQVSRREKKILQNMRQNLKGE